MTPIADMVEQMVADGVPMTTILLAVRTAERAVAGQNFRGNSVDESAERRRAYDRDRKRASAELRRKSAENPRNSETAITNKIKDKKVTTRKQPLPPEWQPNEKHFEAAEKLNIPRSSVFEKAEDMRLWAASSGAVKLSWDATFHVFLRRDAHKLAQPPPNGKTASITPESASWNAWKSHFRDNKNNFNAGHMDKCASDGKAFTVPTEWPPGHQQTAA